MKTVWIILNLVLLFLLNLSWFAGLDNLFGIVLTAQIVLSFPLNLLVGWLFFAFDMANYSVTMLIMGLVMAAVGYVQWFKIVPEIAKFFSAKFAKHDVSVNVSLNRPQVADADLVNELPWPTANFDEQKRSPIERLFSQR